MSQRRTTPSCTNGSPATNSSAPASVANTAIEPSFCTSAKVPDLQQQAAAVKVERAGPVRREMGWRFLSDVLRGLVEEDVSDGRWDRVVRLH